jgi:hypothetical protein
VATYGASVRIDTASPTASAVVRGVARGAYRTAVGEAGKLVLIEHFAGKEAEAAGASQTTSGRRKLGHVGLYADFARSTSWQTTNDGIIISISHPAIRQRLLGGEIKPVNGKYLTLPARESMYGKRAAEAAVQLKYGIAYDDELQTWRKALIAESAVTKEVGRARKDGTRRTKVTAEAGVYFWLVRRVSQRPDPSVLPDDELMVERSVQALSGWVEEQTNV